MALLLGTQDFSLFSMTQGFHFGVFSYPVQLEGICMIISIKRTMVLQLIWRRTFQVEALRPSVVQNVSTGLPFKFAIGSELFSVNMYSM